MSHEVLFEPQFGWLLLYTQDGRERCKCLDAESREEAELEALDELSAMSGPPGLSRCCGAKVRLRQHEYLTDPYCNYYACDERGHPCETF